MSLPISWKTIPIPGLGAPLAALDKGYSRQDEGWKDLQANLFGRSDRIKGENTETGIGQLNALTSLDTFDSDQASIMQAFAGSNVDETALAKAGNARRQFISDLKGSGIEQRVAQKELDTFDQKFKADLDYKRITAAAQLQNADTNLSNSIYDNSELAHKRAMKRAYAGKSSKDNKSRFKAADLLSKETSPGDYLPVYNWFATGEQENAVKAENLLADYSHLPEQWVVKALSGSRDSNKWVDLDAFKEKLKTLDNLDKAELSNNEKDPLQYQK